MNREFLFSDNNINLAPTISKKIKKNDTAMSALNRFNEKSEGDVSMNSVLTNYKMNLNSEKNEKELKDELVKDFKNYLITIYHPYSSF